jgi:LacI family repressor for deo operon, udp, cdd, tsx, nupC, and nupG
MKNQSIQIEIAERAGVSQTLVSFVINNNEKQLARMKPETIDRVRKAASEMGYYRNELFAAMRRDQSRFIAVLARNVSMEYYARVLGEIMDATEQLGYTQKIFKLCNFDRVEHVVRRIQEYRIPGGILVAVPGPIAKKFHDDLNTPDFKTLLIDSDPESTTTGVPISVDNNQAMEQAVSHLAALGHTRIAYVGPGDDGYFHVLRKNAFLSAIRKAGFPYTSSEPIAIDWDMSDKNKSLTQALKHRNRPTAIVCYSDLAAMIVYHAARALSLRIPEDLSVLGFDDDDFTPLMSPPLTTFRQDLSVIRDTYVPELIDCIELDKPLNRRKRRLVPFHLIKRSSTGPVHNP